MIAEVDIFYPLQTKVADFFPNKKPPPEEEEEEEEQELEIAKPPAQPLPSTGGVPAAPPSATPIKPKPKPPIDILGDGDDNYNPQNHPGEIYVTGPPKRSDSGEVLYDIKYKNPYYGFSPKVPYFWQPTKPLYPVSFPFFTVSWHEFFFTINQIFRCHLQGSPNHLSIPII